MRKYQKYSICIIVICLFSVFQQPAHARMLVDYTIGGSTLFDDSYTYDDFVTYTSTNINVNFFGNPLSTAIQVSTNGNMNVSADISGQNIPLPDSSNTLRISPLWDDLIINQGDGAKIVENVDPNGAYYAVSWVNMETYPNSNARQTFQAVLFGGATTIQGFNFQPDDIAFSYQSVKAPFADAGFPGATVGLDAGDGFDFAALPGTTDGVITNASALPGPDSFILFRPDGQGGYIASIQNLSVVVPESGTWLFVTLGTAGIILMLIMRRFQKSN